MNKELAILQLADYKEFFENGGSSCYLIINNKLDDYPCMFGFAEGSLSKVQFLISPTTPIFTGVPSRKHDPILRLQNGSCFLSNRPG